MCYNEKTNVQRGVNVDPVKYVEVQLIRYRTSFGSVVNQKHRKNIKRPEPFIYAGFRHSDKTQNSVDFAFDHSLSHFYANSKKSNIVYPGVAQLGARVVWETSPTNP